MQFTASKHQLCQALALAARVVEKRTTIPILSNVLLRAEGSALHLTATDLSVAIQIRIEPQRIGEAGAITLPARRLLDYCSLLPDGDIKISVGENAWATITAGRARTRIAGMSAEAFPEVPITPDGGALDVPVAGLLTLVARTKLAITTEESRFTLNGALFHRRNGVLEIVATDGHRLAFGTIPMPSDGDGTKFLLPSTAIKVLPAALAGADTVSVSLDENHIFCRAGDVTLVARKLVGNFPDYERVLPKEAGHIVLVDRAEMAGAVARVAQFADERSHAVRLVFKDTGLDVSASSVETGESTDTVAATFEGKPIEIGFNASYLTDFLEAVDSEKIVIHITDAKHAGEFRMAGSNEYRYVLMPMRV